MTYNHKKNGEFAKNHTVNNGRVYAKRDSRECKNCKHLFVILASRKKIYCSRGCANEVIHTGDARRFSIGSRSVCPNGYIRVKTSGGWRYEHRIKIEKKLKRKLTFDEIVHHKNKNKKDNRLDNLAVISRSEHTKLHASL